MAHSTRRVLLWTEVFLPYLGGAEVASARLLDGLRRGGHEVIIVTDKGPMNLPERGEHDGVPVRRFPFKEALERRDVFRIAEIGHQVSAMRSAFAPELVHVHSSGPSLFFHLQTVRSTAAPWLYTAHAPLTGHAAGFGTVLGEVLRLADWIVCVSASQRDSILRLAPEVHVKSSVIHWGLDAPTVAPAPLPFEHPRALCLGRLASDKGFDLALVAFARVAGRFPRLRLLVAGDGPDRATLERWAVDLGVGDRVDFLGRVPEGAAIMNAVTLVLMPSRAEETFGLVALEAALFGRPVVGTRVGALPEVVLDGETGLIVEREDDIGLSAAIASLLEDPERTRQMGRVARERALGKFSLERCLDAYETLYQRFARRRTATQ